MDNLYTPEIKRVLEKFEAETTFETGVRGISGGFATTKVTDHDAHYVYFELKWGIQSDCENVIHTEQYKLDRQTHEITEA